MNKIPMKLRLRRTHASPVEPLPIQLSITVSPSLEYVLMKYSHNAKGFSVGCPPLILGFGISKTD